MFCSILLTLAIQITNLVTQPPPFVLWPSFVMFDWPLLKFGTTFPVTFIHELITSSLLNVSHCISVYRVPFSLYQYSRARDVMMHILFPKHLKLPVLCNLSTHGIMLQCCKSPMRCRLLWAPISARQWQTRSYRWRSQVTGSSSSARSPAPRFTTCLTGWQ